MTDGVVFLRSYYDAAQCLDDNDRLAFLKAILDYGFNGVPPDNMSPIVKALFITVKPNIDSSIRRYEASKENGKKGGRPKKKKPSENQTANLNKDKDTDLEK